MRMVPYVVYARRILPNGTMTQLTKAIREESPSDALIEFCNILGLPTNVLDQPRGLGTGDWDIVLCSVSAAKFAAIVEQFNKDPIRRDFRAG